MELLQRNPFTTIKANDLNDSEINEQWVDIHGSGLLDLFCPRDAVAQYILGGKGSGKTHLMRYFSYKSQLLRNMNNPAKGLLDDGYFGLYFQASGLNGSRFEHLPLSKEAKNAIFEYSFELWCAGLVLEAVSEVLSKDSSVILDEHLFCIDIFSLFNKQIDGFSSVKNVKDLKSMIVRLSNEVDLEVNNSFIKQSVNVEILTNRGALIFGIPQLLVKHSDVFKNVNFLYLIDELENINDDQQIYINTLIREKKLPVTFRIGARRHGIKSWATLGAGETNRKNNEFSVIPLDNFFNDNKYYEAFAVDLIINRLISAKLLHDDLLPKGTDSKARNIRLDYLVSLFEETNLIDCIKSKTDREPQSLSPIMKSFKSRLEQKNPTAAVEQILANLSCSNDLVVEKAAIHIFCQDWYKIRNASTETNLVELSSNVRIILNHFNDDPKNTTNEINAKLDYYSNNYVASALRSLNQNNLDQYQGFNNLLTITKGFPRHILTVLRHAFKLEVFQGKTPFISSSKISLKSQKLALKESADWFHEDCISEGKLGTNVGVALDRLCEILRMEMYADKPVECSASGFTVNKSQLSTYSKSILDWAEMIGVLIPTDVRQDKNSQKLLDKYQLNGLLCPRWGLSLSRRGTISFSAQDFEKIFTPELESQYKDYKNSFWDSRYAPFYLPGNGSADKSKSNFDKGINNPQQGNLQLGWDI